MHQIWDDKIQAEDRQESEPILKSLDWLTTALSQGMEPTSIDGEQFVKVLGLQGDDNRKLGQELVHSLQQARLDGKLTLTLVLDKMGSFYIRAHGASNLWEELRTMSLEGLED